MKTSAKLKNLVVLGLALIYALASMQLSEAQGSSQNTKILDYCSIVKTPERYIGKVIRTRALMTYSTVSRVDGGDSFLYSPLCNNGDYFVVTNYEEMQKPDKTSTFFERLANEKNFIFEVVIAGRFEYSIVPNFGHLSWAMNELKVHRIASIRDVTSIQSYKKPDSNVETPRRNAGSHLRWLNSEIMFYFLGDPSREVEARLDNGLEIVDASSHTFRRSEVNEFRNIGLFDSTLKYRDKFVSGPSVSYESGKYIASGNLGVTLNSGEKKILKYECIYRSSNEGFILEKVSFSNKR